jgi:hypothetical protein
MKSTKRTRTRSLLTLVLICSCVGSGNASTIEHMSIAKMARIAQLIVRAKCVGNAARWQDGEIWTLSQFHTEDAWKGDVPGDFSVRLLGGSVGNITSTVSGVPRFQTGEELVLFLESTKFGDYSVESWAQGTFRVQHDLRSGVSVITQDTAGFSTFDPATRTFRTTGVRGVSVEMFRSEVLADLQAPIGENR